MSTRKLVALLALTLLCSRAALAQVQDSAAGPPADSTLTPYAVEATDTLPPAVTPADSLEEIAPHSDSSALQEQSAKAIPENYGTVTQIEKRKDYNPEETLAELKKGNFGKPLTPKDSLHWKSSGILGLNLSQGSLQNWAAGGDHFSISLGAKANISLNYANGRQSWDNNLDLAFGYLNTTSLGTRKSDDKINIFSRYGYHFSKHWLYSAMISFRSQFANGYLYPDDSNVVSHFLAPAYLLGSLGIDFKPDDAFSLFMSPITSRFVFAMDQRLADQGAFGVDPAKYLDFDDTTRILLAHGKKVKYELGSYISAQYTKDIMKNVNWRTRLELYSNYLHNPGNIDVNWTSLVTLKVNRFITASLDTELIYDDDVKFVTYAKNADGSIKTDPDTGEQVILRQTALTQFKELIGIGFAYSF